MRCHHLGCESEAAEGRRRCPDHLRSDREKHRKDKSTADATAGETTREEAGITLTQHVATSETKTALSQNQRMDEERIIDRRADGSEHEEIRRSTVTQLDVVQTRITAEATTKCHQYLSRLRRDALEVPTQDLDFLQFKRRKPKEVLKTLWRLGHSLTFAFDPEEDRERSGHAVSVLMAHGLLDFERYDVQPEDSSQPPRSGTVCYHSTRSAVHPLASSDKTPDPLLLFCFIQDVARFPGDDGHTPYSIPACALAASPSLPPEARQALVQSVDAYLKEGRKPNSPLGRTFYPKLFLECRPAMERFSSAFKRLEERKWALPAPGEEDPLAVEVQHCFIAAKNWRHRDQCTQAYFPDAMCALMESYVEGLYGVQEKARELEQEAKLQRAMAEFLKRKMGV